MRTSATTLVLVAVVCGVSVSAIATIKQVKLLDGYDDANRITAAVFDAKSLPPVSITVKPAYDRNAKIVRRGATSMFTRGPEYNLDKAVDLGAIFTDSLRAESAAMGFRTAPSSEGWQVDGTLTDIYLESKQIPYGQTLFYGYMNVEFQIRSSAGATETRQMRLHDYFGGYNAGIGRRDEAEAALAHLLVEGAQDAIARLNREFFKAPPAADLTALVARIQPSGIDPNGNELHRVGLSGAPGAAAALLKWIPGEADEDKRSAMIDVLADLAAPDAVSVLSSRYRAEDEDCRWYTLKVMDYLGGDAALAVVRDQGLLRGAAPQTVDV
jgi:hypothetical protein